MPDEQVKPLDIPALLRAEAQEMREAAAGDLSLSYPDQASRVHDANVWAEVADFIENDTSEFLKESVQKIRADERAKWVAAWRSYTECLDQCAWGPSPEWEQHREEALRELGRLANEDEP